MKIRNGFVSNSSSSSFVIIGEIISLDDIQDIDLKSKDFEILGETSSDWAEGIIFAEISNKKVLEFLREKQPHMTVYKAYFFGGEDSGVELKFEKFPKNCKIWSGTMDQHMCYDLADLEEIFENED